MFLSGTILHIGHVYSKLTFQINAEYKIIGDLSSLMKRILKLKATFVCLTLKSIYLSNNFIYISTYLSAYLSIYPEMYLQLIQKSIIEFFLRK